MSVYTSVLKLFKYDPVADKKSTYNITQALNDNWDKIDAAMAAAKSAEEYNTASTYAVGAYCTHNGKLYKCTTAITAAEAWTAAHWTETSVGAEIAAAYTALAAHTGNTSNPHSVTPAQIGVWTKDEVMHNATAALLNLPTTAVPNDVFLSLIMGGHKHAIIVTVKTYGGNAAENVSLSGVTDAYGNTPVTDSSGRVTVVSDADSITITTASPYLDTTNTTVTVNLSDKITTSEITLGRSSVSQAIFAESCTFSLSADVPKYNASVCGGGQKGGNGSYSYPPTYGGNGGNGGLIKNVANLPNDTLPKTVVIGASNGGVTSIGDTNSLGGTNAGAGGLGGIMDTSTGTITRPSTNGGSSSGLFLYPPTSVGGGGGGGQVGGNQSGRAGGTPGGGAGGNTVSHWNGYDATGYGGGGGGGASTSSTQGSGGNGSQGIAGITWGYVA